MRFCDKCNTRLLHAEDGDKCPKCDNYSQDKKNHIEKIRNATESDSFDKSFSYEINHYYVQKEIRKTLGIGGIRGINLNKIRNFLVVFRNTHPVKRNKTNIYYDRYDPKTGSYYYVGAGLIGNQDLNGANASLANAKENNTKIHLFWQHNPGSDHQYIGEVQVVGKPRQENQLDANRKNRQVYVFELRPTKDITISEHTNYRN